jgi:hypothetical protein
MLSLKANEAMVGGKTQIGVGTRQTGQSIEGYAVHSNEYGGRESRLRIEFDPVDTVIVGHVKLNYPLSLDYSRLLYLGDSHRSIAERRS